MHTCIRDNDAISCYVNSFFKFYPIRMIFSSWMIWTCFHSIRWISIYACACQTRLGYFMSHSSSFIPLSIIFLLPPTSPTKQSYIAKNITTSSNWVWSQQIKYPSWIQVNVKYLLLNKEKGRNYVMKKMTNLNVKSISLSYSSRESILLQRTLCQTMSSTLLLLHILHCFRIIRYPKKTELASSESSPVRVVAESTHF